MRTAFSRKTRKDKKGRGQETKRGSGRKRKRDRGIEIEIEKIAFFLSFSRLIRRHSHSVRKDAAETSETRWEDEETRDTDASLEEERQNEFTSSSELVYAVIVSQWSL